jgi:hypothetical protein
MCLPARQTCSEAECERYAMSGTTVCFGHATIDEIVN